MNRNKDFSLTIVIKVSAIKVCSEGNTCVRIAFLIKLQASAYNFIKKKAVAQVFSCEFCRTPPVAASVYFKLRYG